MTLQEITAGICACQTSNKEEMPQRLADYLGSIGVQIETRSDWTVLGDEYIPCEANIYLRSGHVIEMSCDPCDSMAVATVAMPEYGAWYSSNDKESLDDALKILFQYFRLDVLPEGGY